MIIFKMVNYFPISEMRKKIYLMRPKITAEEIRLVKKVFHSKFLTEGEVTRKFEKAIAKYVHSKFAIATTSATTALHTVFECVKVKNKKVLVSDYTFPATAQAIILAGGIPVLVDVNRETMNVTTDIIENALDNTIDYIVPVSIFGNPLERRLYSLRKSLMIIEDSATTLGAKLGKNYVGSFADVSCFSFHPRKIITTGEGGVITTNNKKLADKFRSYKTFGKIKNEFVDIGTNYKLSNIQSAIGLAQLKKIEKIIVKRQMMAKIYDDLLSKLDFVQTQKSTKNARHTYQSYCCVITKPKLRDKIMRKLSEKNVETQIGTYSLHCLPAFKNCQKNGKLKNSEFLFKNSITLPLHEEITFHDQEFICKMIK